MQRPKNFKKNYPKEASFGSRKRTERAILKSLSYRSIFNYPLSFSQLQNSLMTKKSISREDLVAVLDSLVSEGRVKIVGGRYCLSKVTSVDWDERRENSERLIEKSRKICDILAEIPWIKFIGVTGSVAAFNARDSDDIDILVITEKRRLWLSRGFVFLILKILGELHRDGESDRKICPNILIDDSHLKWPRKSRNVYVAHEFTLLYPLYDKNGMYLKFLNKNSWVLKYFGNQKFGNGEAIEEKKARWNILDPLESLAKFLQLRYMAPKKTTEVTEDNIIHFNKTDHTGRFLSEFDRVKGGELK